MSKLKICVGCGEEFDYPWYGNIYLEKLAFCWECEALLYDMLKKNFSEDE